MAHGFLTPQPVSGDRFWQNPKDLYNLYKRIKDLLAKNAQKKDPVGGALATTQKGGIIDESVKAVRVTDVSSSKPEAPVRKMLQKSAVAGALGAGTNSIVKKQQLALPPAGPKLPPGASPSGKGGTFTNLPGISAAPKKLNADAFFKAAQTGVHPETGQYLTSDERKDYLKKSKSKLNASASVASAASPGISSVSSITKGDEAIVGSVDNLSRIVTTLVDAVKSQTATQKQISEKEQQKADTLSSRALAKAEEKSMAGATDNSGTLTPVGGIGGPRLGGGATQGGMGGPAFGLGGKVIANAVGKRGIGRMATRAGAHLAGKQGAKMGAKVGAKVAGKLGLKAAGLVGKKIPLLGLGLGGLFAVQRAMKGDWAGAGMELASGAASTLPGIGTAASVGLDAALMAKDAASGNFAGGGLVTGGKKSVVDDVKINADEGEVVMSNAAGNAFGRSNLMAINAMAGGTNKPNGGKSFVGGGLVGGDAQKSKKMFTMFGEGMIEAQKKNKRDYAAIQSAGLRQYYENDGGGEKLGRSIASVWGKISGVLGALFSGTLNSLMGAANAAQNPMGPEGYLAGDTSSLASFIGGVESGNDYTKLVGGKQDKGILDKTVSQLNQEKGGQFAMGRYQIQMRTAIGALQKAGIDPSKFKFDQAGQDKLFQLLLEGRGYKDFMSGKISKEKFANNLSMEWAALPKDASGKSFYAGDGTNKAHRGWGETLSQLDALKQSGNALGGSGGSAALAQAAASMKGMSSRSGPSGGRNACVWAVNKVFSKAGITPPWGNAEYVPTAEEMMIKAGYTQVSSPQPGDLYVAPGQKHIGVITPDGKVISNSSSGAQFSWVDTLAAYNNYYGGNGKLYRMPGAVAAMAGKPSGTPTPSASAVKPAKTKADLVGSSGRTAPRTAPVRRNTGSDIAQASAFYTTGMRNGSGGGNNTTIINNNSAGGGDRGTPYPSTSSTGSQGMGLTALQLRLQ